MFKKRIWVARTAFFTVFALTVLMACLWKVSETYSRGTGELHVLTGTADEVAGVTVRVGATEQIRTEKDGIKPNQKKKYFYKTRWARVTGNRADTGLEYEKPNVSEVKKRLLFSSLEAKLTRRHLPGMHQVKGSELSYDLIWYPDDGFSYYDNDTTYRIEDYVTFEEEDRFLYYYDGEGEETIEIGPMTLDNRSYTGSYLQEVNGALYGYLDMEPEDEFRSVRSEYSSSEDAERTGGASASMTQEIWDFEETYEKLEDRELAEEIASFGEPDLHMTVKKGIYRFDESGTAACVFSMGERAEGFEFLWLVTEEAETALTIVGKKGNLLLAYRYSLTDGTIREEVLWDAEEEPEVLEKWVYETVCYFKLADLVTEGKRSYLCCTAIYGSQVNLTAFEDGNRVFEGEVLEQEPEFDGIDFSMDSNGTNWCASAVDRIEITVKRP